MKGQPREVRAIAAFQHHGVSHKFIPVAQASDSSMSDLLPFPTRKATHVPVLIQLVVGEFDFFEGHHLLQQLLSSERGVRVYVQPKKKPQEKGLLTKKKISPLVLCMGTTST